MDQTLVLTGDMNFKGVTDPTVVFARIADVTRSADILFGNLECCFHDVPGHDSGEREGFYAPLIAAEALTLAGFDAVGTANNVTYGEAAILASLARLDELGIAHTGAGRNRAAACRPAIVRKDDMTYGFVQRTSAYWPKNQEATSTAPGVAVFKGHTAYRLDDYAAIDSGAGIVLGHGPHYPLGIEIYKDKPILYGTGCFSFDIGHQKKSYADWIGYFATVRLTEGVPGEIFVQLVRRTDRNETILRMPADEPGTVAEIVARSAVFGTELTVEEDRLVIWRRTREARGR